MGCDDPNCLKSAVEALKCDRAVGCSCGTGELVAECAACAVDRLQQTRIKKLEAALRYADEFVATLCFEPQAALGHVGEYMARTAIALETSEQLRQETARKRAPSRDAAAGLMDPSKNVEGVNGALRDIHRTADINGVGKEARETLAGFLQGESTLNTLFANAGPLRDGSLDLLIVVGNLDRLHTDDSTRVFQQALLDYVAFALFAAGSVLRREEHQTLAERVQRRLSGLRAAVSGDKATVTVLDLQATDEYVSVPTHAPLAPPFGAAGLRNPNECLCAACCRKRARDSGTTCQHDQQGVVHGAGLVDPPLASGALLDPLSVIGKLHGDIKRRIGTFAAAICCVGACNNAETEAFCRQKRVELDVAVFALVLHAERLVDGTR